MSERENLGAGIYAALSTLLVLICVIGAFFLPPSITGSKWLGLSALVGYFVFLPVLLRLAHRSRIHDAVMELGGTVVRIKKLPFWNQPCYDAFFLGLKYRVEYVDLLGSKHTALCKSGFFQGVVWLEDIVIEAPIIDDQP